MKIKRSKNQRFIPLGAVFLVMPLLLLLSAEGFAQAQAGPDQIVEEVITIGTRSPGRTAVELPVAVDVITAADMAATGETEVGRMLQKLAPSFNFSSSSISDGTDALRPATLRGLGPDQTLVLVNGKRRHTGALLHINTSVGRGTAGVDLNAIPVSAIKRIEVLRDGAAAQYGSDAIAGVINIVLKDDDEIGRIDLSYGETDEGDGETTVFSANKGFAVGEGSLNVTYEYRDRGRTNRAGDDGSQQYVETSPTPLVFDPREYDFKRQSFRIGDSDSEQHSFVLNTDVPINEDLKFYGFITYSSRENTSGGFYRKADDDRNPNLLGTTAPQYTDGFLPLINTDIEDTSLALGLEWDVAGWLVDAGIQAGENTFEFNISNSLNASYAANIGPSPTSADAGELVSGLVTFNLNAVKDFNNLTLAMGFEYKDESYEVKAGEELSWQDYNTGGSLDPIGIQVFPGFRPENEVDEDRDSQALYVDLEYNFTESFMLGTAIRYEDYSDFGSTTIGKLTGRWDTTDWLSLRGSAGTGFRAPSMQQQFFNNVSTQFTGDGDPEERRTFANDDPVVAALGIPELEEETSRSASLGFVLTPLDALTITVDGYYIEIDDRIVISGAIDNADVEGILGPFVDTGQFFLNGVDTETKGVDLVVTYDMVVGNGNLALSLAANKTETEVVSLNTPNSLTVDIGDALFTEQDISIIEEWQPEDRINLSANYNLGGFHANVSINRYGEYTVTDGCGSSGITPTPDGNCKQTFGAEVLTDLQVGYLFDNGIGLRLGGNNVFDQTPDTNRVGQSRAAPAGGLADSSGEVISTSPGVFQYSRRSAPFGFNGAYYYAGISYDF